MKKISMLISAIATLAGGSAVAFAQAPAPDTVAPVETPSASWVLTPAYASQYMFRGTRLGGESFQPSIEYDAGALAVGVWGNFPISGKVAGQSDPEFDVYGSSTFNVRKDLTLVPGATIYTYPNADKNAGFYKATFEPNLAVNYTISAVGVKLTPKLYYDFILEGPTAELTASFALPLTDLGSEIDFTATYGSFYWRSSAEDTTPRVKNWGDYWLIGIGLPFQLTKDSKLTTGVAYTAGTNNFLKQGTAPKAANPAATDRTVVTVSYAYTF